MKLRKIKNLGEGMVLVIDDNRVKHIISNEQWIEHLFFSPHHQ